MNGDGERADRATNAASSLAALNRAGDSSAPMTIAIDGPAASGKSTIGRALAHALGLLYLDTGTMYRAVTWLALRQGIDPGDESSVTALAQSARFAFPDLGEAARVNPPIVIDGLDATDGIREPTVDANVSLVSSFPGVRAALVRQQQAIAQARGVVMVGRDIGTVVLPRARLKIYLVASAEERARRRYEERRRLGAPTDYDEIYQAMLRRDRLDAERAHSPLRPADDAVELDSTGLNVEDVAARAIALTRSTGL